jgi:hypothetical protein
MRIAHIEKLQMNLRGWAKFLPRPRKIVISITKHFWFLPYLLAPAIQTEGTGNDVAKP